MSVIMQEEDTAVEIGTVFLSTPEDLFDGLGGPN